MNSDTPPGLPPTVNPQAIARAINVAWRIWLAMLATPFIIFLAAFRSVANAPAASVSHPTARTWFIAALIYLAVAIPAGLFTRARLFRSYWRGRPVSPGTYLRGMLAIWTPLALGGILASLGCWLSNTASPNIVPAVFSLALFAVYWPKGTAMTRTLGEYEDAEIYEEPR